MSAATRQRDWWFASDLHRQAQRDLSAAIAEFWRADGIAARRRCHRRVRRCATAAAHHHTALARALASYVRAART
jgi:hypothetical protein